MQEQESLSDTRAGSTGGAAVVSDFQPDVFDNPPGTPGYTPLRRLNLVSWLDETQALEVQSAAAIEQAQADGKVSIEQPGVVINMPFVVWGGGQR